MSLFSVVCVYVLFIGPSLCLYFSMAKLCNCFSLFSLYLFLFDLHDSSLVCVCVRACVRACVPTCVCVCVCVNFFGGWGLGGEAKVHIPLPHWPKSASLLLLLLPRFQELYHGKPAGISLQRVLSARPLRSHATLFRHHSLSDQRSLWCIHGAPVLSSLFLLIDTARLKGTACHGESAEHKRN